MSFSDRIRRAFRAPAERPADIEHEVDEELQFHIAMREAALRKRGIASAQAAEEARRRFGDVPTIRAECVVESSEQVREERHRAHFDDVVRDVRVATRSLRRSRGFTAAAVTLLALGIGGTTSVFSVVNAIYFRPLPYPNADRLAIAGASLSDPSCASRCDRAPIEAEAAAWVRGARTLDGVGLMEIRQGSVLTQSGPLVLEGVAVNSAVPSLLGLRAAIGRGLLPTDFADGAEGAVVMSHSAWQSQFGGDSSVVGQTATFGDETARIVGVLGAEAELGPPIFSFNVRTAQYMMPRTGADPGMLSQVIVRIRPGSTIDAARAELDASLRHTSGPDWRASVRPLRDVLSARYRASFGILLGAVVVVLLITCMNVAGLLLARLNDRMPELATRAVLGAGRVQLVQQVITETFLIGLAGGGAGLALGYYGTTLTRLIPAERLPFWTPVVMDSRVIALAIVLSLAGALALSVAPIVLLTPARVVASVRDLVTAAPARARIRGFIVSIELALSVILLTAAGMLAKQLIAAEHRDLGTAKHSVLFVFFDHPIHGDDGDAWLDRVSHDLASVPGIVSVGAVGVGARTRTISPTPAAMAHPTPGARPTRALFVEGGDTPIDGLTLGQQIVGGDYFGSIGTPIVEGRAFAPTDTRDAAPVAIIDAESARRAFPGTTPLGRRIKIGDDPSSDWLTIVGVAATVRGDPLTTSERERHTFYRPLRQMSAAPSGLNIRVEGDARRMIPALRRALHSIDPTQPVASISAVEDGIARRMWAARFNTDVLLGFAALAVVLACLGIYATMSYVVGRRRRELAIRMAIGATQRDVVRIVLRSAFGMLTVGLAAGLAGSLGTSKVLQSMLYGASGVDSTVLAVVLAAMLLAGGVAAYFPARRAARNDPSAVLRAD